MGKSLVVMLGGDGVELGLWGERAMRRDYGICVCGSEPIGN